MRPSIAEPHTAPAAQADSALRRFLLPTWQQRKQMFRRDGWLIVGLSYWPVNDWLRYVPGIRLDHVCLGGGLTCSQSRTGTGVGSDHRPIIARVALTDAPAH